MEPAHTADSDLYVSRFLRSHREWRGVCPIKHIKEQRAREGPLPKSSENRGHSFWQSEENSNGPGKDLAVDFGEAVGVGGPGEEADAGKTGGAAGMPGVGVRLTIGEKGQRGGCPGGNVANGTVHRRVAADFAQRGEIAGEQRNTARERLSGGKAEAFGFARLKHQGGAAIDGRERRAGRDTEA